MRSLSVIISFGTVVKVSRIAAALAAFLIITAPAYADSAADVAHLLSQLTFDADECYRVSELNFSKEDLRFYFTSGYLSFAKPIEGRRIAAVFTTDVEAGDGEVLLIPPDRSERLSLANFTGSPNLDEHFKGAVLIFTDATGDELMSAVKSREFRKSAEMGALFADRWSPALQNLASSFEVRLVHDLLSSDPRRGLFYMGIGGSDRGNFDVIYDPASAEDITIGQLNDRESRTFFDTWASFAGSKQRRRDAPPMDDPFTLDNFRIDAVIHPDLSLSCTTRVTATPHRPFGRTLPLWISRRMRVTEAKIDGQPAEVFQHESLRANLIDGTENGEFLVVMPPGLDPAKPHEIELHNEGAVIHKAGKNVLFVSARGIWYPRLTSGFAHYDLTFRYPGDLVLVATGDPVSNTTDGDWRVSRFRSGSAIRFAGFNLGSYECASRDQNGYSINVCANREIEAALRVQARPTLPAIIPHPEGNRRHDNLADSVPPPPPPNPVARLQIISSDVAGALQYMTSLFGPPCVHHLTVAPIPGGFGQGFPGLIYLSTLSYLDPTQRPAGMTSPYAQLFFSDVLDAHEVAHEWWGNLMAGATYSDEWMMEALADYSALMYLEKKAGPHAVETVLDRYRVHLLQKNADGGTVESSGPITWGLRLISSRSPEAWRTITYEKGAWIIHMIRRRLGDERFIAMLRRMCEQYRYRAISTAQFRELVASFAPPKSPDADFKIFFDNWVYGTGVPSIKLTHSVRGNRIVGTITANGAGDDFNGFIPVEVQQGRTRSIHWLQASSDGTPYTITLRGAAKGAKVSINAYDVLIK